MAVVVAIVAIITIILYGMKDYWSANNNEQ